MLDCYTIFITSWDAWLCWGFKTMDGNVMVKKLSEVKLGFWDNVWKYNGEKLLEMKLGFWDNVQKCND